MKRLKTLLITLLIVVTLAMSFGCGTTNTTNSSSTSSSSNSSVRPTTSSTSSISSISPDDSSTSKSPIIPRVDSPAESGSGLIIPEIDSDEDSGTQTPSSKEEESSNSSSWVPSIIDRDESSNVFDEIDDSVKYTYNASTVKFTTVNGSFSTSSGSGTYSDFKTTNTYSLAVCTSVKFPYGTLSCDMKNVSDADSGIVFGLSGSGSSFWEGSGVSYYFFFLNKSGVAYLGKTDNGNWSVCKYVSYSYNTTSYYNLKVVFQGSKICCYVNGELLFAYRDSNVLKGTGFGIRSSQSGVEFKNISVTNNYNY